MKTRFVLNPRADLSAYPRALRKAIRQEWFHPAKPATPRSTRSNADVDESIHAWDAIEDPAGDAHYLSTNTVDPDFDIDSAEEFEDHDNPYEGLTIVEPGFGNIRRWLRGRDIL